MKILTSVLIALAVGAATYGTATLLSGSMGFALAGGLFGSISGLVARKFAHPKLIVFLPLVVLVVITFPSLAEPYPAWYFILAFGSTLLLTLILTDRKKMVQS